MEFFIFFFSEQNNNAMKNESNRSIVNESLLHQIKSLPQKNAKSKAVAEILVSAVASPQEISRNDAKGRIFFLDFQYWM